MSTLSELCRPGEEIGAASRATSRTSPHHALGELSWGGKISAQDKPELRMQKHESHYGPSGHYSPTAVQSGEAFCPRRSEEDLASSECECLGRPQSCAQSSARHFSQRTDEERFFHVAYLLTSKDYPNTSFGYALASNRLTSSTGSSRRSSDCGGKDFLQGNCRYSKPTRAHGAEGRARLPS